MGDYDTKAVDRRGPSMASQLPGDQFAGAGMGDPGDSKQAPSGLDPKETLVSSGLEHSTETYTRLTAALRHNSDYTLAFSMIGVMCMMVQVGHPRCFAATSLRLTAHVGSERASVGMEH